MYSYFCVGQMRVKGMSINLITYNSAITALSKASRYYARSATRSTPGASSDSTDTTDSEELWPTALHLLGQMKDDGIEPDGFSFSAAISCCGAEGRWKEALELIRLMKKGGPRTRPNRIAYTAAISEFKE